MAKKGAQAEPEAKPQDEVDPAELSPRIAKRQEIMDRLRDGRMAAIAAQEGDDDAPAPDDEDEAAQARDEAAATAAPDDEPQPKGEPGDRDDDDEPDEPEAAESAEDAEEAEGAVKEPDKPAKQYFSGDPSKVYYKTTDENGNEVEVPLSDMANAYQRRDAGERRFAVATKTLEEAQQLKDRLTRGDGAGPRPSEDGSGGNASQDQRKAKSLDDIKFGEVAKAMQYDDPEAAGQALRAAVEQIISLSGDPNATRDELETQIMNKLDWQNAVERFKSEYTDVVEDPVLKQVAGNFGNAIWAAAVQKNQQEGAPLPSYWQVWDAAGRATKDWLVKKTGDEGAPNKNPNDTSPDPTPKVAINPDRTERKRVAAQPPEPRTRQTRPERDEPPTNSEKAIIASRQSRIKGMQDRRGQDRIRS